MAIDVSTLTDYAWADIAKAAKGAMMSAALGGGVLTINGKTIQRISVEDAEKLYDLSQKMIAIEQAGTTGLGNVLVRWGSSS